MGPTGLFGSSLAHFFGRFLPTSADCRRRAELRGHSPLIVPSPRQAQKQKQKCGAAAEAVLDLSDIVPVSPLLFS